MTFRTLTFVISSGPYGRLAGVCVCVCVAVLLYVCCVSVAAKLYVCVPVCVCVLSVLCVVLCVVLCAESENGAFTTTHSQQLIHNNSFTTLIYASQQLI